MKGLTVSKLKKGSLYEMMLGFFLLLFIVAALFFVLFTDTQTLRLFLQINTHQTTINDAQNTIEQLKHCYGATLTKTMLDKAETRGDFSDCNIQHRIRIAQKALGSCEEEQWNIGEQSYTQTHVTTIQTRDKNGHNCAAQLEIYI